MPNPSTHLLLLYDQFSNPTKNDSKENFEYALLGSVSPDLRVITKSDREDYHYFDLNSGVKGDGMSGFIKNTIDFNGLIKTNIYTNNFIKGYFSHLIADENWTVDVFRKIFMDKNIFPDFDEALFLDRALQIYLDIQISKQSIDIYSYLSQVDIDLIFLPHNITKKTLNDWITFLSDLNSKYGSNPWNRLNFMAQRLSKSHNSDKILTLCDDFMADITKGIKNLLDRLPEIIEKIPSIKHVVICNFRYYEDSDGNQGFVGGSQNGPESVYQYTLTQSKAAADTSVTVLDAVEFFFGS